MLLKTISLIVMALFYIVAGINHFRVPKFYLRIMPPYLPNPKLLNALSGIAEVVLGVLLLVPATSQWAAWGVIALLIAVYPANIYHYTSKGAGMNISQQALAFRLAFQFVFIAWAWWHTF